MNVQKALRAVIQSSGRSQRDLAVAAGIHYVTLNRFARGNASVTVENAEKLATVLGYEIVLAKPKRKSPKS